MANANMVVRLGVDASSFLKKMTQARFAAESAGQRIKKSLTADQRNSLEVQLNNMKASYEAVQNATKSVDLSRPLTKQIEDSEKAYHGFLNEAQKTKDALRTALSSTGAKGSPENVKALRRDLDSLRKAAEDTSSELKKLKQISDEIGPSNINFASHTGLKKLESEIRQIEIALDETGDEASQSESFISRMSRALRSVGNSGKQMHSIPNLFRRIGDSAGSSDLSISKMVRSIRNISLVSAAVRIAGASFGRLRSIVSSYISENSELQAQVDSLKNSMGQALAPAINIVTNAFSYLMPYVVGVSNAIGQLMAALTGSGWSTAAAGAGKTAAATGGAAKAQKELNRQLLSFDQINRMDSNNDSSNGGSGGSGSAIAQIESKTPAWMERFMSSFAELFNSSEFQAANIGGKIGMVLQTGLDWLGSDGMNFDWRGVGTKLRENFDSFIGSGWVESLFHTLGIYCGGFADMVIGFLGPQWEELESAYQQQGTIGAIGYILGLTVGLVGNGISGLFTSILAPMFSGLADYFREHGNYSVAGFFQGIADWMANAGQWIKENFTDPIVSWIKNLFGIHSPSTVFASIGNDCMDGLGTGFTGGVSGVLQKLTDLKDRVLGIAGTLQNAFSFEWQMPQLRLPHLQVDWDPVDNVLAQFFGVTAFPRLSVSWFAKGGILDGAQIFGRIGSTLLGGGEQGREAVLPLDTNTGWMDVIAQRIATALDSQGGGDVNANINLILDGEVLTTYVLKGLRRRSRAGTA